MGDVNKHNTRKAKDTKTKDTKQKDDVDVDINQLVKTLVEAQLSGIQEKVQKLEGEMIRLTLENEKQETTINKLRETCKDLEKSLEFFNNENKEQTNQVAETKKEMNTITSQITKMEAKRVDLEDRSRRDNVIFWNLPEENYETNEMCEQKLKKELTQCFDELKADNIHFERVHRLGKRQEGKNRAVIAKMTYFKQKEYIMRNAKCLGKSKTKMTVCEDFSKETVDVRDKLFKAGKTAKQNFNHDHTVYEIKFLKLSYRRLVVTYFHKTSQKHFTRSYSEKDIDAHPTSWYIPSSHYQKRG